MGIEDCYDVVVMGSGPAGLVLAVSCSQCGLSTACVDHLIDQDWVNHYALWPDEVTGLNIVIPYRKIWPRVAVWIDKHCQYLIERPYGLIDNIRLKEQLLNMLAQYGGVTINGAVRSVACEGKNHEPCVLALSDNQWLSSKIVFDATGQNSILSTHRYSTKKQSFAAAQRAVGCWAKEEDHPFDPETAVLMDFRDRTQGQLATGDIPSFLYALPINSRQVYLEETSLIRSPGLPFNELQPRLVQRFHRLAMSVPENQKIRKTHIIMDLPVPDCSSGMVAVGAAGGMIHPATGYSVANSLLLAPKVARVLADAFSGAEPADNLPRLVQQTIWPWQRRLLHHFFMIAAAFLKQLSLRETRYFMKAFFKNSIKTQRAFFSGYMTLADFLNLAVTMFKNLSLLFTLKILCHFVRSLMGGNLFLRLRAKGHGLLQRWRNRNETA